MGDIVEITTIALFLNLKTILCQIPKAEREDLAYKYIYQIFSSTLLYSRVDPLSNLLSKCNIISGEPGRPFIESTEANAVRSFQLYQI